ncbi:MAG: hypothetical protein WC872_03115 [Candidatus Absconditabacterales bacterium]
MANVDLIQKKLPQELRAKAQEFNIPDKFLEEKPELIVLILKSKSMDTNEEKQSWFNLFPLMNQTQIDKLNDILTREKQKLDEIEKKYEQKKEDIGDKYSKKWEEMGTIQNIKSIQKEESINKQKDDAEADALINQI